jgi:hypothetical protein
MPDVPFIFFLRIVATGRSQHTCVTESAPQKHRRIWLPGVARCKMAGRRYDMDGDHLHRQYGVERGLGVEEDLLNLMDEGPEMARRIHRSSCGSLKAANIRFPTRESGRMIRMET